jgi:hippurate hydrolase
MHMTCELAAAEYLIAHPREWSGTLVVVGQPAEEIGSGARAMLSDGLFVRFPRPDFAIALHVDPEMQSGKIGYRAGYLMASVDSVDVTIRGKGGHGAFPHKAIDPIVQAAHLILDVQSLVSRENNPLEPAVITVGSIHGGTKHNIIDNVCKLQMTVRSYNPEVRQRLLDGIVRKAKAVALSAGADEPTVEFSDPTPSTRNDPELVERLVPVFRAALGGSNVLETQPVMGGEDFSEFGLAGVPIAMFRLGTLSGERLQRYESENANPPSLHSSLFYPEPESTIRAGTLTMVVAALELLKSQK